MRIHVNGVTHPLVVRGFCDTGSQVNLISERCVQAFRIYKHKANIPVTSIVGNWIVKNKVFISLMHRSRDDVEIPIEALIFPKIGGSFPDEFINKSHIESDKLADPEFHIPRSVDLLLSVGVWATIICPAIERSPSLPNMVAQLTSLGYVIYGLSGEGVSRGRKSYRLAVIEKEDDIKLDQLLLKYWNADEIPIPRKWTCEEELVEANFVNTHTRDTDGRYVVTIPRKENYPAMANSYNLAKACFLSVERKMINNPDLRTKYREVMDDYRAAGHMIEAPPHFEDPASAYYMPHHPINHDPARAKGKFRVVFNASAATSNSVSFNDQQLPGPKLQSDLFEIFIKFRLKKFALTADIKQMFRQVKVAPSEYDFQRILWRDNEWEPIKQYFITVVSWGMTSAGFNSVRALKQCALDGRSEFPLGSEMALNDFYYDDMLSGAHSEEELISKQREVTQLLSSAGMELTKFCTNSTALAQQFDNLNCEVPLECGLLGMKWHTRDDLLYISTAKCEKLEGKVTKRKVVSALAKVYDPSGLILPVIVTGKIIQQDIWRAGVDWEGELPAELLIRWQMYEQSIKDLELIKIPRWIGMQPNNTLQLHVFADSSESAMGACAYLVSRGIDGVSVHLITSRSRVAPVKKVTIPRLELTAAVMAARLASCIAAALQIDPANVFLWSDSTITLHWTNRNPLSLTPYIANRVTTIQELTNISQWRHVPGTENPADLLTRGATTEDIGHSQKWWHGPSWLSLEQDRWQIGESDFSNVADPEQVPTNDACQVAHYRSKRGRMIAFAIKTEVPNITIAQQDGKVISLLNKHSELEALLRVTAYVLRFISILKRKVKSSTKSNKVPPVTNPERRNALKFWIKHTRVAT